MKQEVLLLLDFNYYIDWWNRKWNSTLRRTIWRMYKPKRTFRKRYRQYKEKRISNKSKINS